MGKASPDSSGKKSKKVTRWVILVFVSTLFISAGFTMLSEIVMDSGGAILAFFILLTIIAIGIVFDTIGVAVTSADEKPFHSMAARKVPGAREAIGLLRNAGQVSSVCNDVIGDICGVVSGAAAAAIAAKILADFDFSWPKLIRLILSSLVAGLTVGGKAIGKQFAINRCTEIVYGVGKLLYMRSSLLRCFSKKKKVR